MSLYQPDSGAMPNGTAFIAQLSQRDISLQVPINYVTHPGVATSAACFANGTYEDTAAAKCFSNLLATGFRRYEIDLYWDVTRNLWSLCPVQLAAAGNVTTTADATTAQVTTASLASGQLTGRTVAEVQVSAFTSASATRDNVVRRQTSGLHSTPSSEATSPLAPSLTSVSTTSTLSNETSGGAKSTNTSSSAASPAASAGTLIRVGPYSCTPTVNLDLFTDILTAYLESTETNLNATLRYLTMNLHAAVPASDPTGSAKQPSSDELPQVANLLSTIISSSMSQYLYTPTELLQQRADLNATGSWFSVTYTNQPLSTYFEVSDVDGRTSTLDGWPSESFIEIQKAKRLLASYGEVDPQMLGYNFSGDASSIFPKGYLQSPRTVTTNGGQVNSGCFFDANVEALSAVNSSWATTSLESGTLSSVLPDTGNITACGISPILNETLNNITAAEDYRPYQSYVAHTVWPWALGEPQSNASSDQHYRCAALNATAGQWQVADCTDSHYAACRVSRLPYSWEISYSRAPYDNVNSGCPSNTTFSTPRTALENTYLLSTWKQFRGSQSGLTDTLLWVNANNLDAASCWVVGQNTTCPYLAEKRSETREVVVPTVAGVIVFVLAALTVFVKCAANRQSSRRRRRRREDNWDYEGVPS